MQKQNTDFNMPLFGTSISKSQYTEIIDRFPQMTSANSHFPIDNTYLTLPVEILPVTSSTQVLSGNDYVQGNSGVFMRGRH